MAASYTGVQGPAVERQLAGDMVRRALPAVPVLLFLSAVPWGVNGALSAGYGVLIVLANLVLSAGILSWTARVSLALLMGGALAGYLIRLGLVVLAFMAVKDAAWLEIWPFGLTLVVTHLGLLFWETAYVSASLAFPGLKPKKES